MAEQIRLTTLAIAGLVWVASHSLARGHVPFRRDRAVWQRAAAKDRPHRAQGIGAPCAVVGPYWALRRWYTWPVMDEALWDDVERTW